jgi:small subunit ribosomal protein S20
MNAEDKAAAEPVYKEAVSALDKNASRGILHKNTAARKKAALTKYLNSLAVAPTTPAKEA